MPVGKYYCDYCDKEFQDMAAARKRHLQSLQHLRSKAQWFHSVNANAHASDFAKGVCNRFLQTGFCRYGDNCKYFHPNNANIPQALPTPVSVEGAGAGMLQGNLPPSLKPPPDGGYPPFPSVDWG